MIELFSANTPNGWKISIMLEEIGYEYKVSKIDLGKDEQFKPEFKRLSPFSKIPIITDHENKKTLFESGAILIYLANLSGEFYGSNQSLTTQWLMAQMAIVGPMIGQHHQFHYYHQGKSEWGEERYFKITRKIYEDLEARLAQSKFLANDKYSIADIATWSWIARHKRHAEATRLAVKAWGLEILCKNPNEYSNSLTAVMMPDGHDADALRKVILDNYNMSLGMGLNKVKGKVFRIGHLGDFNDLMLSGTLAGVEMGLAKAGVPFKKGGILAALDYLSK